MYDQRVQFRQRGIDRTLRCNQGLLTKAKFLHREISESNIIITDPKTHLRLIRAHAAQGGVTLGPEQGELGANFCYLGLRKHRGG